MKRLRFLHKKNHRRVNQLVRGAAAEVMILFFLLASLMQATAQDQTTPVVALAPFVTDESDSQLITQVSSAAYDIAHVTFRFMGTYTVKETETQFTGEDLQKLRRFCEKRGVDNVVFGTTSMRKDGTVVIRLAVYDRLDDEVTVRRQAEITSLLDIFATTETLVSKLVEGFSGIHVEYGSLAFRYTGEEGKVTVSIDGKTIGTNIHAVPRMITGTHTVEVSSIGDEAAPFFQKQVRVETGKEKTIRVDVPFLNEKLRSRIHSLDRTIAAHWHTDGEKVQHAFEKARELLTASQLPGARRARSRYSAWQDDYKSETVTERRISDSSPEVSGTSLFPETLVPAAAQAPDVSRRNRRSKALREYVHSSFYTSFPENKKEGFSRPMGAHTDISRVENGQLHMKAESYQGFGSGTQVRFLTPISRSSIIYFRVKFGHTINDQHPYAHFNFLHNGAGSRVVIMFTPDGVNGFSTVGGSTTHGLFSQSTRSRSFTPGTWYELRFFLSSTHLTIYLNGSYYKEIPIPRGLRETGSFVFECHNEYWVDEFGYITLAKEAE